jgi:hypothetical protein
LGCAGLSGAGAGGEVAPDADIHAVDDLRIGLANVLPGGGAIVAQFIKLRPLAASPVKSRLEKCVIAKVLMQGV